MPSINSTECSAVDGSFITTSHHRRNKAEEGGRKNVRMMDRENTESSLLDTEWLLQNISTHSRCAYLLKIKLVKIPAWMRQGFQGLITNRAALAAEGERVTLL